MITNDDIRRPEVLDVIENYMVTYPFSDLTDGMELFIHHDPQPNEHMFSLIVNHNSCMAGYSLKEVQTPDGMKADHSVFLFNNSEDVCA
jgi:hypothetical protein